jgi:uracil-DNA glycosylase
MDRDAFYDPEKFAIVPMGFCYPGKSKSGDLPPRPECAPAWRQPLLDGLEQLQLTLLIGTYAMQWHLPNLRKQTLTAIVRDWRTHKPAVCPLPHPSPRNIRWFKQNPWFEAEVVPYLQARTRDILGNKS